MEAKRRRFHWLVYANIPAAVLAGVFLPLRIVFFDRFPRADWVVDASLLVLVALRFATHGSSYADRREPRRRSSLRRTASLLADILTAVPLVTLLDLTWGVEARYLFLLKLLFLRRLMDVRKVLDSHDSVHPAVARLIPVGIVMPLVVHVIACGWIWLGSGSAGPSPDKVFEYGRAVYWAVTTLCTVGYGDITGRTLPQMFYANGTMVVGVAFFGYVLSNIASLLARMDAAREEYMSLLDKVESFMRYNDLPAALRSKVRAYYRYLWESRKGYDDSSVLADLPQKLRVEVSLHMNAEIIEKVPLLRGADQNLLREIVLLFKPRVAVPGEEVFRAGDPGDAMYFIHRGPMEILSKEEKLIATLQAGSFFGEMALLTSSPRNATARAVNYCDLSVLSRESFEGVLHRHPRFGAHVREAAAHRAKTAP
jgi:voltage-gated potassium channel